MKGFSPGVKIDVETSRWRPRPAGCFFSGMRVASRKKVVYVYATHVWVSLKTLAPPDVFIHSKSGSARSGTQECSRASNAAREARARGQERSRHISTRPNL